MTNETVHFLWWLFGAFFGFGFGLGITKIAEFEKKIDAVLEGKDKP